MRLLPWLKLSCKSPPVIYLSSPILSSRDFWQYFEPIRLNMPKNCSADVQAVISYVDYTFTGNNATAIQVIKDMFGMSNMTHLDDVAGARGCTCYELRCLPLICSKFSPQQSLGLASTATYLWPRNPVL